MHMDAMEQYWVWLSSVEGIGPVRFYQLMAEYGDPRAVWDAAQSGDVRGLGPKTKAKLREACSPSYFYKLFENLERRGVTAIARISEKYSPLLASIADAPPVLYVKGNTDLLLDRPFGIVGTRNPTVDGERAAREFSERLAKSGATVVSGLARGVDTCAHTACLEAGGRTVAVLGCGVDRVYPADNERLYHEILESGGSIVSEYAPGTQPMAQYFPARNRIISGLSVGTLLVEGTLHSGGLITANDCLEQGRDLFVIPGPIYAPLSEGPNRMLMQGAQPAISPWDIPEHYGWAHRPSNMPAKKKVVLSAEEKPIVELVQKQDMTVTELAAETGFNTAKLISVLTMLELRGIICKVPGGAYHRK